MPATNPLRSGHPPGVGVPASIVGLAIVVGLLGLGALSYAYGRIGISAGWMIAVLASALLGSAVNLPVAHVRRPPSAHLVPVRVLGAVYLIPARTRQDTTVIAVNVGGAIVPVSVAGYLIVHDRLGVAAALATVFVACVVFAFARPVPGLGIVTPALLPPLCAAFAAVLLGGHSVAAVAYVAGTLGTLVGADLLNLPRVRSLGAPFVSIGGAGTFDGIFLTGVLAVLLATLQG